MKPAKILQCLESEPIMRRGQIWLVCSLGVAILALMLLAASLPQLSFHPGRAFSLPVDTSGQSSVPTPAAGSGDFLRTLLSIVITSLLVILAIGLIFSAQLRREFLKRVIGVLVILLLLYLVVNALNRVQPPPEAPAAAAPAQPAAVATAPEPLPPFVSQPPAWLTIAISVTLVALLGWGIWVFWKRGRVPENPLVALAQEALADLQAGGDLRDTVMRCYIEMGRVLSAQRGVERQRAMTPREFEQQLASIGVRDEHIQRLTRLFEHVRYGAAHPSERDEREATECLTAIVQAYGRSS